MNELLPCPFCNSDMPRVHTRTAKTSRGVHCFVRCPTCHTEGPRSTLDEAEAIAAWNRRAPLAAHPPAAPAAPAQEPEQEPEQNCKHWHVHRWTIKDTTYPDDMWGCTDCGRKFQLTAAHPPAQDAQPVAWMNPKEGFVKDAFIWTHDPDREPQFSVPVYTPVDAQDTQDAKDAARYRWLRYADDVQIKSLADANGMIPEGEAFDAAIDHAIAQDAKDAG